LTEDKQDEHHSRNTRQIRQDVIQKYLSSHFGLLRAITNVKD
jgi:hypothetical protein